jgi:hypothetical protein
MAIVELPSGLIIQTYPPPPLGFDFERASDRDRATLGLPRLQAAAAALQSRIDAMARRYEFVEATVAPNPARRPNRPRFTVQHANETQDIWAGGITFPAAGDTMTWVEGAWTVPSVTLPPGAAEGTRYTISTWVGMDGDTGANGGSGDVLQAGCDAQVTMVAGQPQVQFSPWIEWAPAGPTPIRNMPVSAGDFLRCIIRLDATSASSATIHFGNQTRNVAHTLTITAPQGWALVGNCAEWIVESNASLGPAPEYNPVTFTNCNAGTRQGATVTAGAGQAIDMIGGGNQLIAHGAIVDATTVQVSQA